MSHVETNKATKKLASIINEHNKGGLVKLTIVNTKVKYGLTSVFELKYNLENIKDVYIRKETYANGNAYIYLNEHFYNYIQEQAALLGYDVRWNNTYVIGWLVKKKQIIGV